jgi:hypothetical protein
LSRIVASRIALSQGRRVIVLTGGVNATLVIDASRPRTRLLLDGVEIVPDDDRVSWSSDTQMIPNDPGKGHPRPKFIITGRLSFELPYEDGSIRGLIETRIARHELRFTVRELTVWVGDVLVYADEDDGRTLLIGTQVEPLPIPVEGAEAHAFDLPLAAEPGAEADSYRRRNWTLRAVLIAIALLPLLFAWLLLRAPRVPAKRSAGANTSHSGSVLIHAVRAGELETVRSLLQRGVDPNTRQSVQGPTALMEAAHYGYVEIARILLDAGAEVNALGSQVVRPEWDASDVDPSHRITPLIQAVWALNADVVRLLLDRGADPDAPDTNDNTAREWANNLIPTTDPETSAPRMKLLTPILDLLSDPRRQQPTVP